MRHPLAWLLPSLTVAALLLPAACSDETSSSSSESGSGGDAASSGQGGDGGSGGGISSSNGGAGGGVFVPTGSGGGGGMEGCLATEAEAQTLELDMVVVLDRSASMSGNLWTSSISALTQFFNDPGAAGVNAGINYFPPPGNASECNPNSYNPLQVPIVSLDTDAATLINDMQSQMPQGDYTPTHGALYGSLQFANQYQDANPDHVVVVVFASDGDPTSCNTAIGDIAAIASTANGYNGVRTFVIAIDGATVANLDQIAAAGGTNLALDVTQDITLFKQKMDEIRESVLACEFLIPEPGDGEEFDPTKVNIVYTPGGGSAENIPQAENAADCGSDPGWYYDNPINPTKITFCPATCATIQMDSEAKVDFAFGCPTVVN